MLGSISSIVVLIVVTVWIGTAAASEKKVIIVAGQSNAVGFGSDANDLPPALSVPQTDILFWFEEGPWDSVYDPARRIGSNAWIPLQYQSDLTFGTFGWLTDGFGSEIKLGRVLADSLAEEVVVIKFAINATSLAGDWNAVSPGPLYGDLILVMNQAMSQLANLGHTGTLEGCFWMQGEWDALNSIDAAAYQANLVALIQALRADLGSPGLPFILGRLNSQIYKSPYGISQGDLDTVRAAQQQVADTVPMTALVDTDDLPLNSDFIHFTADGQILLGQRFADAYQALSATTVYVPDNYATIQDAIDAMSPGSTIIVRPGVYTENIDFLGKAVTVKSEQGPEVTSIDGGQSGSTVTFDSGEWLDTVLDGFTVANGSGTYDSILGLLGGGIYCAARPTVVNNIIRQNGADYGGGIYCIVSGTFENNVIAYNHADFGGGVQISDAFSSGLAITGNLIANNRASRNGGAISIGADSHPTIDGNTITNNTSGWMGGAIYCGGSEAMIINNVIAFNLSDSGGGLFFSSCSKPPVVANNLLVENAANLQGGGVWCNMADPYLINNTLVGNSAGSGGGIYCVFASPTITNSILWNNLAGAGAEACLVYSSTLTISYSDVANGQAAVYIEAGSVLDWGAGMIDSDPLFVDLADDDYHLTYDSACKDAGDNSAPHLPQVDFEGNPRIVGGAADMGADEYHFALYYTGRAAPGAVIEVRVIGDPHTSPVILALGSDLQDPPQPTPYGSLHLVMPPVWQKNLGAIPPEGVASLTGTIPLSWQPGDRYPFQALLGSPGNPTTLLTNLMVLEIESRRD